MIQDRAIVIMELVCDMVLSLLTLKVYSNELFFISTNDRLMYKFYKNCNYFIFK